MPRTVWLLILVLIALGAMPAQSEEAVTFKSYLPKVGDQLRVSRTESDKQTISQELAGRKHEKTVLRVRVIGYTDEVLAVDDTSPSRQRRVYAKYEITHDGKVEKLPVAGKSVLIERKGEGYEFRVERGEVIPPEVRSALGREWNRPGVSATDPELLPSKALKPGETWKLDLKKLFRDAPEGTNFDVPGATGSGKLVKLYQARGATQAVLDYSVSLPAKVALSDVIPGLTEGSKITIAINCDVCVDGTAPNTNSTTRIISRIEAQTAETGTTKSVNEQVNTLKIELIPPK